jgi:ketosteroid isomerase-like protein
MKIFTWTVLVLVSAVVGYGETAADRASLLKTTAALRDAFAQGDVDAIVALHDPAIVKYFGGANVVLGRENLKKGLSETFKNSKMEFIGNQVESTLFHGDTAVETSIFTMRVTFKDGRPAIVSRGRAMVVYVKSASSPTGWASIREMAQSAPEEK